MAVAGPELGEVGGFTQVVGGELEQRFGALVPKLLGPLDPAVDMLDRRLDVA